MYCKLTWSTCNNIGVLAGGGGIRRLVPYNLIIQVLVRFPHEHCRAKFRQAQYCLRERQAISRLEPIFKLQSTHMSPPAPATVDITIVEKTSSFRGVVVGKIFFWNTYSFGGSVQASKVNYHNSTVSKYG